MSFHTSDILLLLLYIQNRYYCIFHILFWLSLQNNVKDSLNYIFYCKGKYYYLYMMYNLLDYPHTLGNYYHRFHIYERYHYYNSWKGILSCRFHHLSMYFAYNMYKWLANLCIPNSYYHTIRIFFHFNLDKNYLGNLNCTYSHTSTFNCLYI